MALILGASQAVVRGLVQDTSQPTRDGVRGVHVVSEHGGVHGVRGHPHPGPHGGQGREVGGGDVGGRGGPCQRGKTASLKIKQDQICLKHSILIFCQKRILFSTVGHVFKISDIHTLNIDLISCYIHTNYDSKYIIFPQLSQYLIFANILFRVPNFGATSNITLDSFKVNSINSTFLSVSSSYQRLTSFNKFSPFVQIFDKHAQGVFFLLSSCGYAFFTQ